MGHSDPSVPLTRPRVTRSDGHAEESRGLRLGQSLHVMHRHAMDSERGTQKPGQGPAGSLLVQAADFARSSGPIFLAALWTVYAQPIASTMASSVQVARSAPNFSRSAAMICASLDPNLIR